MNPQAIYPSPVAPSTERIAGRGCSDGSRGPADLIRKIAQRTIEIGIDLAEDAAGIESLMERYADTPMSVADACLVRLSERYPDCRLFTLDSDFEHCRRNGRSVIPLLRPSGRY